MKTISFRALEEDLENIELIKSSKPFARNLNDSSIIRTCLRMVANSEMEPKKREEEEYEEVDENRYIPGELSKEEKKRRSMENMAKLGIANKTMAELIGEANDGEVDEYARSSERMQKARQRFPDATPSQLEKMVDFETDADGNVIYA